MAVVDQGADDARAIPKETWLSTTGYFIKRYPLGAIGALLASNAVAVKDTLPGA